MPRRDFGGVPDLRTANPDPIVFGFAGGSFTCQDDLPPAAMAAVGTFPTITDDTDKDSAEYHQFLGQLIDFLLAVVVDGDRTALLATLTSGVDDVALTECFGWVTGEYTKLYRSRGGGAAGQPAPVPQRPTDDPDGVLAALPRSDLEDVLAVANMFGGTIGEPLS
jgi:hypothetical protein